MVPIIAASGQIGGRRRRRHPQETVRQELSREGRKEGTEERAAAAATDGGGARGGKRRSTAVGGAEPRSETMNAWRTWDWEDGDMGSGARRARGHCSLHAKKA